MTVLVSTILFGVCLRKPTGVRECASSIRRLSTPCGQLNELRKKNNLFPATWCPVSVLTWIELGMILNTDVTGIIWERQEQKSLGAQ